MHRDEPDATSKKMLLLSLATYILATIAQSDIFIFNEEDQYKPSVGVPAAPPILDPQRGRKMRWLS